MANNTNAKLPAVLGTGDIVAGRFRITGVVGKGAMGSVYQAEHVGTGQAVALKFMILGEDEAEEFATRFEQEARVMATLRHPNTIRIYDFGRTDDGAMFMAMELLVGQPLDKVIRENTRRSQTMTEADAVNCGIQMLKSLAEAHGRGLVHRDLKPGNVFLTDDGGGDMLLKVLDFGIARVQDSALTNAGRILGTPSYMSPEQWQGAKVDARADLYAVGCVLYCCVTGQPPFSAGDNMLSLLHKHCSEAVPDPRVLAQQPLSDPFIQVITTALAKLPDDRFADARGMRTALEAVAGGAWAGTPSGVISPATQPYARGMAPTLLDRRGAGTPAADHTEQPTLLSGGRSTLEPKAASDAHPAGRTAVITAIVALGLAGLAAIAFLALRHGAPAVIVTPSPNASPPTPMPSAAAATTTAIPSPSAPLPASPAVLPPAPVAAPDSMPAETAVPAVVAPDAQDRIAPLPTAEPASDKPARRPARDKPATRKQDGRKVQFVD